MIIQDIFVERDDNIHIVFLDIKDRLTICFEYCWNSMTIVLCDIQIMEYSHQSSIPRITDALEELFFCFISWKTSMRNDLQSIFEETYKWFCDIPVIVNKSIDQDFIDCIKVVQVSILSWPDSSIGHADIL